METEKAHPLQTLMQELESMMKRKTNMLEDEDEGSSSMNSDVVNTKIIRTREPHETESRDLLSDLPDSLIHHIFSFLPFNHSPKLAILSTRFRHLTITSAILSFKLHHHDHACPPDKTTCSSCDSFVSYISNFLDQRKSSFPINSLSFFCHTNGSNACIKHFGNHQKWIRQAITTCHVEELLLKSSLRFSPIHINPCRYWLSLFNHKCSLKSLVLEVNGGTLKFPEFLSLPSLHTLFLRCSHVDLSSSPSIDKWICRSFPNLKKLTLKQICGITCFNIRSMCLEDLTIDLGFSTSVMVYAGNLRSFYFIISGLGLWDDGGDPKMEIFAPNLEKLRGEGNARKLSWDGEMPRETLQDVCFMFHHYKTLCNGENDFVSILQSVRYAKRLCIDSRILKFFLEDQRNLFGNLRHLSMTIGSRREYGKYIFPMLERSPNIESLVIRERYYYEGTSESRLFNFVRDYEDDDKVLRVIIESSLNSDGVGLKSIGGLKKVEIKISEFNKEIILVIGMVMKICKDLEKMTIIYPYYCEKWKTQLGVQDTIQRFDRASSSLQLVLLPTNYTNRANFHGPCGSKNVFE